jgi:AAA domain
MADQLSILLSHRDDLGQYRVTVQYGMLDYFDFFNPADEWRRKTFAQNTVAKFGWEETAEHIEEIMTAVHSEFLKMERSLVEELDVVRLSDLRSNGVAWLWPGRIAQGTLCVLAGDPGLGKSLVTLDIAARATRGAAWPDESGVAPVTSVFLMSTEDDYSTTIRPRLEAAGADLERVSAVLGMGSGQGSGRTQRLLDLANDLDHLREKLSRTSEPRLLVVDPVASYLGTTSENANAEIRRLLTPLSALAQETNTAMVLVSHLRKSEGSNLHRIIGSIAFAAIARSAFVVQKVPGAGEQRRLSPVKSNLGGARTAIYFHLEEHPEHVGQPHVVWGELEPQLGEQPAANEAGGRPEQLSPEARRRIDARLAEGPATISELRTALGSLAPPQPTLYRYINKYYQWMDEKRGRDKLIILKQSSEE